jgi:hypothetical protein
MRASSAPPALLPSLFSPVSVFAAECTLFPKNRLLSQFSQVLITYTHPLIRLVYPSALGLFTLKDWVIAASVGGAEAAPEK